LIYLFSSQAGVRQARSATFRRSGKVGAPEIRFDCFKFYICPAGMLPGEKNRAAFAVSCPGWSDEQTSSGSIVRPPVSHRKLKSVVKSGFR
jgi:hypothetical protein